MKRVLPGKTKTFCFFSCAILMSGVIRAEVNRSALIISKPDEVALKIVVPLTFSISEQEIEVMGKGTGVIITKNPDGSFSYNYQPVDAQPNVFLEKMYFMSIQQSEISKNGNLIQSPNW